MNCKKKKYWEIVPKENRTTDGWNSVNWSNEHKLGCVDSYFFRYDNYFKGLENEFIMKSVFGRKNKIEILKEIDWWFDRCIGVYNDIEFKHKL